MNIQISFFIPEGQMAAFSEAKVLSVKHYTDRLFSFSIERDRAFRFRSGEFVMIGLMVNDKPLVRAYSIASPSWDEKLDFYSIKVPDGPLTSILANIKEGDNILIGKKPTGTLVLDALTSGKRLFMFATGTGIAPFASLIRDPETYERFDQIILTQTCRTVPELQYGFDLVEESKEDPLVGEFIQEGKLILDTAATREDYKHKGRVTDRINNGTFFSDNNLAPFNPETDRAMICGSMDMLNSCKQMLDEHGFIEGSVNNPGQYVYEKSFVG